MTLSMDAWKLWFCMETRDLYGDVWTSMICYGYWLVPFCRV